MKKIAHILVVDDEQPILYFMKKTLELEGYTVTTASDGQSALGILEHKEPDLVILDVRMPGANGYQILRNIRKKSKLPVLMSTANEETLSNADLFLSTEDYIIKPFTPELLLARIKAKLKQVEAK